MIARLCPLALALSLTATPAWAHKMKLFVTAEGNEVVGTLYFAGGDKAIGVKGEVLAADGHVVAPLTTDSLGGFRYSPPDAKAYRLHFQSADGHMAEAMIGAASSAEIRPSATPGLGAPLSDAALDAAIARQLRPLREQIDSLDGRTRLSDLIGGAGFIFGLFGCFAWVQARRRGNP